MFTLSDLRPSLTSRAHSAANFNLRVLHISSLSPEAEVEFARAERGEGSIQRMCREDRGEGEGGNVYARIRKNILAEFANGSLLRFLFLLSPHPPPLSTHSLSKIKPSSFLVRRRLPPVRPLPSEGEVGLFIAPIKILRGEERGVKGAPPSPPFP